MTRAFLCLMLCAALICSGCSAVPQASVSYPTLPPAACPYPAPEDDGALLYQDTMALYLPSMDGQRLICQYAPVERRHGVSAARALTEALLAHPGSVDARPLSPRHTLSLQGDQPVEVAGGVCTVNLASTALQLERRELYTLALALSATLGQLPEISGVNLLVAGRALALDIIGSLPLGTVLPRPGEELPLLWEQMEARRTPLGESPAAMPLTATATLYFPLEEEAGFLPETRTLSFPGQSPEQLAAELISALSAGPLTISGAAPMPNLDRLMAHAPTVTDMADGGYLVSLYFVPELEKHVGDLSLTVLLGAVHRTLCTFIPSVSAVRMYEGSSLIAALEEGEMRFPEGLMRRQHFDPYLLGQARLYLPQGQRLSPVLTALPWDQTHSPRALMDALLRAPTPAQAEAGFAAPLPPGLSSADILGMAITADQTLLMNLSPAFAQALQGFSGSETLACYAMVTTLGRSLGVERVRFFFGGQVVESLGGTLYWGGEFLLSPGIIR